MRIDLIQLCDALGSETGSESYHKKADVAYEDGGAEKGGEYQLLLVNFKFLADFLSLVGCDGQGIYDPLPDGREQAKNERN